jgi:hypothetical protein
MSSVNEALNILETPEFQGGLEDHLKIVEAIKVLREVVKAEPVEAEAAHEQEEHPVQV